MDSNQEIEFGATEGVLYAGVAQIGPDSLKSLAHDLIFELMPLAIHHGLFKPGSGMDELRALAKRFMEPIEGEYSANGADVPGLESEKSAGAIEIVIAGDTTPADAARAYMALAFLEISLGQCRALTSPHGLGWQDCAVTACQLMWSAKERIFVASHSSVGIMSQTMPTSAASALAHLRHAENRDLAEYAEKYWLENIDRSLSAEKAASILEGVVKLSHKKLAQIVSGAKKKSGESGR